MICPGCDTEIDKANVYSECRQVASLDGDTIDGYGPVDEVLETRSIECPECATDLKELINEG